MTTFDNREHAYENKFAYDQETEFKINARRNKLIGLWAAEKLNLSENDTKNYTETLVAKTTQKDSAFATLEHILNDFLLAEIKTTKEEIEAEMIKLLQAARDQITSGT